MLDKHFLRDTDCPRRPVTPTNPCWNFCAQQLCLNDKKKESATQLHVACRFMGTIFEKRYRLGLVNKPKCSAHQPPQCDCPEMVSC